MGRSMRQRHQLNRYEPWRPPQLAHGRRGAVCEAPMNGFDFLSVGRDGRRISLTRLRQIVCSVARRTLINRVLIRGRASTVPTNVARLVAQSCDICRVERRLLAKS